MEKKVIINSDKHNIELISNGCDSPQKIILCLHGFTGNRYGDGYKKLCEGLPECFVCSFDSAGHGNSEVNSLDMRMELITKEILDVLNYLNMTYENVPIVIFATSYGAYRAMIALQSGELKNVKQIVFVSPAFKMLNILEKWKEFNYNELTKDAIVPMKRSQNRYLKYAFLEDLNNNSVYNYSYTQKIPIKIYLADKDFVPKEDTIEFSKIYPCDIEYIIDEHCPQNETNWQNIIEYLRGI